MSTDVSGMIECRPGARLWGPDDEDSVWEVGIDLFLLRRRFLWLSEWHESLRS